MPIDIESIKQAFSTLAAALAVIKQARDLLHGLRPV